VSDPLYQFGASRTRKLAEQRIALVAIADPCAQLDELVIGQRAIEFGDQAGADAALSNQNDRRAIVSKPAEMFLL
jgi:hypothetical protein